jgi:hypothetical protein
MATKKEFYAYALGYFHGRTVGVYDNLFCENGEPEAHLFKQGYDSGVADYCEWDTESEVSDE